MKKKETNLLIISSLLLSISLSSCSQTIFSEYVKPFRITIELANEHIANNEVYTRYVENDYWGRVYYHTETLDYSRDKLIFENTESKNKKSVSWDTDYGHNTSKGGSSYFLMRDMEYHTYNWFKINLTDMEDVQLDYIAGYISYYDFAYASKGYEDNGWEKLYKRHADDENDGLKIIAYFFPTKDDETKVYNYVEWRVNDFFNYIVPQFRFENNGYSINSFGSWYDSSTDTIYGGNESIQNSSLKTLENWKNTQLSNFKNKVKTAFEEEGAFTTSEIQNWLESFESNLGLEILDEILKPYDDAVSYWYKLYNEKVKEIRDRESQIRRYQNLISSSNNKIANYEQKIEDLKQENIELEDAIVQDENNANEAYSQYLEFVAQENTLRAKASEIRSQAQDIRNSASSVDKEYEAELNSAYINLRNAEQDYFYDASEENRIALEIAQQEYDEVLDRIANAKADVEQQAQELEKQADEVDSEAEEVAKYVSEYKSLYNSHLLSKVNHQNQIQKNLQKIADYEQKIINEYANIEFYKEEIERLEKEIEELIPPRDYYYSKWKEWVSNRSSARNSINKMFRNLKKIRDKYYEDLIEKNYDNPDIQYYYYNDNDVDKNGNKIFDLDKYGLDQPDIWCFGKSITPIRQDLISNISDYSSIYQNKHNPLPYGDSATILPFGITNNGSMKESELTGDLSILGDFGKNFTFNAEMNECTMLVKIDYPDYFASEGGKRDDDIDLCIGNIHFVPASETYTRELEEGKYEDWEIEMMNIDPEGKKEK